MTGVFEPLMMVLREDDDNMHLQYYCMLYVIVREEEYKQQPNQPQPQPQRAWRAAVRQFWVQTSLIEEKRQQLGQFLIGTFRFAWTDTWYFHSNQCFKRTSIAAQTYCLRANLKVPSIKTRDQLS